MACACISRVFCCPCNCCSATAKKCSFRTGGDRPGGGSVPLEETGDTYFGAPVGLEMERKTPLLSGVEVGATIETAAEAVTDNTDARIKALEKDMTDTIVWVKMSMGENTHISEVYDRLKLLERTRIQVLENGQQQLLDRVKENEVKTGVNYNRATDIRERLTAIEDRHSKTAIGHENTMEMPLGWQSDESIDPRWRRKPTKPVVMRVKEPEPKPISEFEALFANGTKEFCSPEHERSVCFRTQMVEEKTQALQGFNSMFKTQGCDLVVPENKTKEERKLALASAVVRSGVNHTDEELLKMGLTRLDIRAMEEKNKLFREALNTFKPNRTTRFTDEEIEQHRIARKAAMEDPRTTDKQRTFMENNPSVIIYPIDSGETYQENNDQTDRDKYWYTNPSVRSQYQENAERTRKLHIAERNTAKAVYKQQVVLEERNHERNKVDAILARSTDRSKTPAVDSQERRERWNESKRYYQTYQRLGEFEREEFDKRIRLEIEKDPSITDNFILELMLNTSDESRDKGDKGLIFI